MAIQLSNSAEIRLLTALLSVNNTNGWAMRLYKDSTAAGLTNNTPQPGSTAANFTEATFAGYSLQPANSAWPTPTTDGNGKASSQYPFDITFTCTGGVAQTVYGWYITDNTMALVMAEKFPLPGPYPMVNNGDFIKVRPTFKLFDPLT